MNDNELISVVIPVYNVEPYLSDCLDSVINQTYKNLQIIIVNDGSTDNSLKICKEFEKRDERVVVIDKINGGLSEARNFGINFASGSLISFVDSDDMIEPNFFDVLLDLKKRHNANISICSYFRDSCCTSSPVETVYSPLEILNNYSVEFVLAWNKLYDKSLFDNVRFPVGKVYEDEFTTHKLIIHSTKIAKTSQQLYFYRNREDSITQAAWSVKNLDALEALEYRLKSMPEDIYTVHRNNTKRVYAMLLLDQLKVIRNQKTDQSVVVNMLLEKLQQLDLSINNLNEIKNIKWLFLRYLILNLPNTFYKIYR